MRTIKIVAIVAALASVAVACSSGGGSSSSSTGGASGGSSASSSGGPLAQYGESINADPALVQKAMGPVTDVPDIVLAAIARANQNLDQATIDKAMECWKATKCDTGTGGDVTMGYADGGDSTSGVR